MTPNNENKEAFKRQIIRIIMPTEISSSKLFSEEIKQKYYFETKESRGDLLIIIEKKDLET